MSISKPSAVVHPRRSFCIAIPRRDRCHPAPVPLFVLLRSLCASFLSLLSRHALHLTDTPALSRSPSPLPDSLLDAAARPATPPSSFNPERRLLGTVHVVATRHTFSSVPA